MLGASFWSVVIRVKVLVAEVGPLTPEGSCVPPLLPSSTVTRKVMAPLTLVSVGT